MFTVRASPAREVEDEGSSRGASCGNTCLEGVAEAAGGVAEAGRANGSLKPMQLHD